MLTKLSIYFNINDTKHFFEFIERLKLNTTLTKLYLKGSINYHNISYMSNIR